MPCDPAILLLVMYIPWLYAHVHGYWDNMFENVHSSSVSNTLKLEQPKCPSTVEWLNKFIVTQWKFI